MMKINKIWFDHTHMYGQDEDGHVYCQSLLWYRRLVNATPEQLQNYNILFDAIHWPELDEDIGLDSFVERNGVEPTSMQTFFLTHREINLAEFAKTMGINGTLLRNYVYGWKIPSQERIDEIITAIHKFGQQLISVPR